MADQQDKDQTGGADQKFRRQTAIAIKGTGPDDPAPRITAIGHGENAEKMLDIAFATNVKVRRDEDLTEVLGAMEMDSIVPMEALEAVGEILTYVYRANNSWSPAAADDISLGQTLGQTTGETSE
jgi:flagellar biosynthesis protein